MNQKKEWRKELKKLYRLRKRTSVDFENRMLSLRITFNKDLDRLNRQSDRELDHIYRRISVLEGRLS